MTDQQLTFRASMQSVHVQHFRLATDLGPDEIKRRLRGNWLDRYRSRRDMRAYRRWERKHDKARAR